MEHVSVTMFVDNKQGTFAKVKVQHSLTRAFTHCAAIGTQSHEPLHPESRGGTRLFDMN